MYISVSVIYIPIARDNYISICSRGIASFSSLEVAIELVGQQLIRRAWHASIDDAAGMRLNLSLALGT